MLHLDDYDMSEARGFLCRFNANQVTLTGDLATARDVALSLPKVLPTGRVRAHVLEHVPLIELPLERMSDAEARICMLHYSFLVQAFVWGGDEAAEVLPACLAIPISALADHLGQQPLMPYSAYVLDNWGLIDPTGSVELGNIHTLQSFFNGQDENWFVLTHVAIEATAGKALAAFGPLIEASHEENVATTRARLEEVGTTWKTINSIFDRIPERCDPNIFFDQLRPYLHGWKDNPALPNGIVYEGVKQNAAEPQAFRGETGSQSSIIPAMDALMGVGHASDPLKDYLDELHIYRPPAHRRFIDDTRAESRLRAFVERAGDRDLTEAYNSIIQSMADFRTRHLEYAARYINKQSRASAGNDTGLGTGGTPFMRYLKKHRNETAARLISPTANAA